MEIVLYGFSLIILYYSIQIWILIYGFYKTPRFYFDKNDQVPSLKFSIIVPFKNESKNLEDLLNSINQLDYNKLNFEVILVNDSSTDNSVSVIHNWRFNNPYVQLTILDNVVVSKSSKKDAITRAICVAKHDWILTTDADCILPNNLLNGYSSYYKNHPDKQFLIGGVSINKANNFLSQYQSLDFASLQAVTIGSFGIDETFMCNGANLAFTKKVFNEVGGYKGVNHIASGDDVFLLQKILNYNVNLIGYILNNESIVLTKPVLTWKSLIIQRARWGKKSKAYQSLYPKVLGIFTLLANISCLGLFYYLFQSIYSFECIILLTAKFVSDLSLLLLYKRLNKNISLYLFPISFVLYPIITFLVGLRMIFYTNNWNK